MQLDENGFIILVDIPKPLPPEFRAYYDETGRVTMYTCEKPEGQYIVVDAQTYAASPLDMIVLNGELVRPLPKQTVHKLMPAVQGQSCAKQDVSIVVGAKFTGETQNWKMVTYEL
jgi:hypothetical protein